MLPSLATLSVGNSATVIVSYVGYQGKPIFNKANICTKKLFLPLKNGDVGRVTSGGRRQLVLQLICHVIVPSSGRAAFKYPHRRTKDQIVIADFGPFCTLPLCIIL